jgi:UDP-glucose 4-epimerase
VKIAVTGGGGFIGQSVMMAGRAMGHEMLSFDHRDGNNILGPLTTLDNFGAESVIHLAGVLGTHELFDNVHNAIDVNIHGTVKILDWCRHANAGYVGITMPPVFPSIYTATKICTDRIATAYHREYGVPVAKVRAFNAFGPGQAHGPGHPQKIIPTFAVNAWQRKPIPIWGDGAQTVDLIDVGQIARILVEATYFGDDATIDAGSGVSYPVRQIADVVSMIAGSQVPHELLPMRRGEQPTDIRALGENWDRLSFTPALDWEALEKTVHAYHMQAKS